MASAFQGKHHDDVEKVDVDRVSMEIGTSTKSPEEKALVRKIDLYLMPLIFILYLLAVSPFAHHRLGRPSITRTS
jgi:hypothetical protein